jgi:hypothetical protein
MPARIASNRLLYESASLAGQRSVYVAVRIRRKIPTDQDATANVGGRVRAGLSTPVESCASVAVENCTHLDVSVPG